MSTAKPRRVERGIQVSHDARGRDVYRVQVLRRGRTYLDKRFHLLKDAREARARAETAANDDQDPDWAKTATDLAGVLTVSVAIDEMLLSQVKTGAVRPKTAQTDQLRAGRLKQRFGTLRVDQLSPGLLEAFLDEYRRPEPAEMDEMSDEERRQALAGTLSRASLRQYLGIISKTYTHLAKVRRYAGAIPTKHVQWPEVDRGLDLDERYIPRDVLKEISQTAHRLESEGWEGHRGTRHYLRPGTHSLIVFLATGGLRMGEALDISVGQASAEYLSVHRTKSARPRTIPLIPAIERAIAARISQLAPGTSDKARLWHEIGQIDEPLPTRWSWIVINRALSLKYRIHDLRHTAISNLYLYTDLRDQEITAISGHLSSEILARYAHLRTAKLAERASAIGADLI